MKQLPSGKIEADIPLKSPVAGERVSGYTKLDPDEAEKVFDQPDSDPFYEGVGGFLKRGNVFDRL